jgi:hypothetical protein
VVDVRPKGFPGDRPNLGPEVLDRVQVRKVHPPRVGLLRIGAKLLGVHAKQQDFYALDLLEEKDDLGREEKSVSEGAKRTLGEKDLSAYAREQDSHAFEKDDVGENRREIRKAQQ